MQIRPLYTFLFIIHTISIYGQVKTAARPHFVIDLPSCKSKLKISDASDGWVYSVRDVQIDIASKTYYNHYKRKIYTESGVENASEISIVYDPVYEKIIFHDIKIIRNTEKINKLEVKNIKIIQQEGSKEKHLYDGSLTAFIVLDDVRINDEIEFSYSIIGSNPIFKDKFMFSHYLGFYDKYDQLLLRIVSPQSRIINYKAHNINSFPEIVSQGVNKIYSIYLEDVAGKICDTDLPSNYDPYPSIDFSEFTSWVEVKNLFQEHFQIPQRLGVVKNIIDSIKKKYPNSEGRICASLQFVQNEIRYVALMSGIGGYKPESPEKVYKQRFGDCKGKSLLLCAILKEMNITAYPAFLHTVNKDAIHNNLPAANLFNHCVVKVELNGKTFWYDPTTSYQRGSYDSIYFGDYRTALVMDTGSFLTDFKFTSISKSHVEEDFFLDKIGGVAVLQVKTEYFGGEADYQRYYYATTNIKQIEKNFINYYAGNYPDIELKEDLKYSDDQAQNKFTVEEKYLIPNFWTAPDTSNPGLIKTSQYAQVIRDRIVIPTNKIRSMPLAISYPLNVMQTIRYHLPEEWNITKEDSTIDIPGMKFSYHYTYHNKIITLNYSLTAYQDSISANETPKYVKTLNNVIDQLGYELSYEPPVQNETTESYINISMIYIEFLVFVISLFCAFYIYRYDPIPQWDESKPMAGWLFLPLLGLFITIFSVIYQLYQGGYFTNSIYSEILDKNSSNYNLGLYNYIIFELAYNIMFIVYACTLLILYINKRSSVPRLMILFYGVSLLMLIIELSIAKIFNFELEPGALKELMKGFVAAAIWIPFFIVSINSKETFTMRLGRITSTAEPND